MDRNFNRKTLVGVIVFFMLIGVGLLFFGQSVDRTSRFAAITPTASFTNTAVSGDCSKQAIPALTEGPYYSEGSPQRQDIRDKDTAGIPLTLEGYVVDTNCQPIANAWLDFWQADGNGAYDTSGYALRGHQYTDANGYYKLQTIVPGHYTGRTEHIHFKVRAREGGNVITSQLFFPGSSTNAADSIYDAALLVNMTDAGDGKHATYNIVVER